MLLLQSPILRRSRADVDPLPLRAEQAEQLDGLAPGAVEPVRYARIKLGGLAGVKQQVVRAKHQPKLAAQDIQPFITLVRLKVRVHLRPNRRNG